MSEILGNLGYLALKKESTPGQAVTPNVFTLLYSETLNTNFNFVEQSPIYGSKFKDYDLLQGMRSHRGDVTVPAEPNTAARFFDMLLTKTSTTGSGPYTHTYKLSTSSDPKSYTIDVSTGLVVKRFIGAQASQISLNKNGNELQYTISISALKSFTTRRLAGTPTGSGPYTVVLDTTYDPSPTDGLVVDDLVQFKLADGSTINTTVDSIVDGTSFTVDDDVTSAAAGAIMYLRPATPTYSLLSTLLWARTQFRFGDTASAALSATQTRVEDGSTYDIIHSFENEDGSMRSGSFDPASLPRTTGTANITISKIFEGGDENDDANNLTKKSLVIRHYTGATNQYEVRPVFNHIKTDGTVIPQLNSGDIEYEEINFRPINDTSDGQGMEVVVINNIATI